MIADLKPYPVLKDFDDLRIGEVPEHWEIEPLCAIAKLKSVKNQHDRELLSVYLNLGVVPFATVKEKRTNATSEDLSGYQAVDPGDFVLNNQQAWRGSVGVSMHKGIVSPAYLVLSLGSRIHPRYANLLLRERSMVAQYLIASKGVGSIQRNLYWPHLKRIPIILPPFPEQAAIVRFLDHADRKIRRYIHAKQKLINLLEEQKQAIIHRAVTRGLDPNVRLKPSGVEWLGDVPEHWDVRKLKDVAGVQTGLTLGKVYLGSSTNSYPYLRVANVQVGRVDLRHVKHIDVPEREAAGAMLRPGDVLMTEGGDIDKLGRGCVWHAEIPVCLHQNHVFAVRCKRTLLRPEFLEGLMASEHGRTFFQLTAKQTTNLAATNSTTLRTFPILLPPLDEQQAIIDYIARRTDAVSRALEDAHSEIILLREYRIRLIADVVTGQLDVREAAAQLLDEDQELPPLDGFDDISDTEEGTLDDLDEAPEDAEP